MTESTRLATAQAFASPRPSDTTSRYDYVYIPRGRRMDRKDMPQRFQNLGIDTVLILDISFPARSIIGVLFHSEYQSEFLELLAASRAKPIEAFNLCAQEHVVDPRFHDLWSFSKATEWQPISSKTVVSEHYTSSVHTWSGVYHNALSSGNG